MPWRHGSTGIASQAVLLNRVWIQLASCSGDAFGGGFAGVRDCIPCGACLAHAWSVGGSHIAHRAVFSLVCKLPLSHGRAVGFGSVVLNQVLGGWSLETIVGARTGLPSRRIGAMPVRFARLQRAFAPT